MLKYSDIKKQLNLNVLKEKDESAAYFTHYLYNQNSKIAKYFKKEAETFWKNRTNKEFPEKLKN